MPNTFFTADPHFNHAKIIQHCNRPFSCVEEMDEAMIENWNTTVGHRDKIIVLGDYVFYSKRAVTDPMGIFRRLNGQKHLIIGNHDREATFKLPWAWVKDTYFLKHLNQEGIWLSHYPHRSWRNSFHGSWHLFGHNHGNMPPYGKSFDIGVDCWDFTPVEFEIIKMRMDELEGFHE